MAGVGGIFGIRTFAATGTTSSYRGSASRYFDVGGFVPQGTGNPGSWAVNQPFIERPSYKQLSDGFSNASGVGSGNFGRLAPFNPDTVYPSLRDGKLPNRAEPTPGGQAPQGDDKPAEEQAEPATPDTEITENTKGKHKTKEKLKKPQKAHERVKKGNKHQPMKHLGVQSLDKEGSSGGCGDMASPGSLPDDIVPMLGNVAREISTQVPAMQQLLQNLPNQVLGNFLGNLPSGLQSFIPPGLINGLNTPGLFNLNGLIGLVGGAAIGNIANDALRSLLPAIGIPQQAISQLTSIPLNQISGQLSQVLPQLNQLSTGINSINNTAMNAASVARALSNIQIAIGNSRNSGIPLEAQQLNQAIVLALNSSGLSRFIPTNLMGLANSFVQNPMGSIINAAMGSGAIGATPLIPSNLSNSSGALLSGLSQFLPANVVQGLFNAQQLINMLPGNLQNLIPTVAPIIQGAAPNLAAQAFNASPEKVGGSDIPGGNQGSGGCKIKQAPNDGKNAKGFRDINYAQPLSPNFDLWQLVGTAVEGGSHRINEGQGGSKPDEVIKNLSSVAVNVLEPLKEAYPLLSIISGYRESGDHAKGKSVDVAFPANPTKLMEIADWARQNLPVTVEMNMFKTGWLHLKFEESCKGGAASTASSAGCESGLVNRKG